MLGNKATQTVVVSPALVVHLVSDTSYCYVAGSTLKIGGNPTVTGGTGPYIYNWSPTVGLEFSDSSNPTVFNSVGSEFCVNITDAHGCTATGCINVTPNPAPVVDAGLDKSITGCSHDTVTIGGNPDVSSGGTAPFVYFWHTTSGGSTGLTCTTCTNPDVVGLSSTTGYVLVVTDHFGCKDSDNGSC